MFSKWKNLANTIVSHAISPIKDEPEKIISINNNENTISPEKNENENKSKLVKKFFYGDEEKKEKQKVQQEKKKKTEETKTLNSALEAKIEELNQEIENLKQEKERFRKQKVEQEKISKKLEKEIETYQKQKEKESAEFEEFKKHEIEKMKKEKRVFERQIRAMQNIPNRKEREEIEQLKKEVSQLKEEMKNHDTKNKLNADRMKKQIDDLSTRNSELENEIKLLEDLRMKGWNSNKNAVNPTKPQSTKKLKENCIPKVENQAIPQPVPAAPLKISPLIDSSNSINLPKPALQNSHEKPTMQNIAKYQKIESQSPKLPLCDENEPDTQNFILRYPIKYHGQNVKLVSQTTHYDGKIVRTFENGKTEFILSDGTRKEIYSDGYTITFFSNNDIKQVWPDNTIVYYTNMSKIMQTTLPDNTQIHRFGDGQIEKNYTDGAKEILMPNGTVKCIFTDGEQEIIYPDGTVERIDKFGKRTQNFECIKTEENNEHLEECFN